MEDYSSLCFCTLAFCFCVFRSWGLRPSKARFLKLARQGSVVSLFESPALQFCLAVAKPLASHNDITVRVFSLASLAFCSKGSAVAESNTPGLEFLATSHAEKPARTHTHTRTTLSFENPATNKEIPTRRIASMCLRFCDSAHTDSQPSRMPSATEPDQVAMSRSFTLSPWKAAGCLGVSVDVRRISTPANPQRHPIIRMET